MCSARDQVRDCSVQCQRSGEGLQCAVPEIRCGIAMCSARNRTRNSGTAVSSQYTGLFLIAVLIGNACI